MFLSYGICCCKMRPYQWLLTMIVKWHLHAEMMTHNQMVWANIREGLLLHFAFWQHLTDYCGKQEAKLHGPLALFMCYGA